MNSIWRWMDGTSLVRGCWRMNRAGSPLTAFPPSQILNCQIKKRHLMAFSVQEKNKKLTTEQWEWKKFEDELRRAWWEKIACWAFLPQRTRIVLRNENSYLRERTFNWTLNQPKMWRSQELAWNTSSSGIIFSNHWVFYHTLRYHRPFTVRQRVVHA